MQSLFGLVRQQFDSLYLSLNLLEGHLCLCALLEYQAGYGRVLLRPGQFFQKQRFLALVRLQEGREIILRKQDRTGKLVESQAYQFDNTRLKLRARPRNLLSLLQIPQRELRLFQPSVLFLPCAGDSPTCPKPMSVNRHKVHLRITGSRSAPQQETRVALRQLFVVHILQADFVLPCLLRAWRTAKQSQAHRIQQRRFACTRRSGNGKYARRGQRFLGKINLKRSLQ